MPAPRSRRRVPEIPASAITRSRPAGITDGRSDLEVGAAEIFRRGGLPPGTPHYHFAWCCQHTKGRHRGGRCLGCVTDAEHRMPVVSPALHEYSRERDWAFDRAWPAYRVAVELEGGVHVGGRHVRGRGYENDCQKYNAATLAGWRVLRFTSGMLDSGEALETLERALGRS